MKSKAVILSASVVLLLSLVSVSAFAGKKAIFYKSGIFIGLYHKISPSVITASNGIWVADKNRNKTTVLIPVKKKNITTKRVKK